MDAARGSCVNRELASASELLRLDRRRGSRTQNSADAKRGSERNVEGERREREHHRNRARQPSRTSQPQPAKNPTKAFTMGKAGLSGRAAWLEMILDTRYLDAPHQAIEAIEGG
jgi:hypothetical protein